jgi:hypothetical protein
MPGSLGASLFSLVFVAVGAGILYYARGVARKMQQSLSWPSARGEIAHSAVFREMQDSSSSSGPTYKADVAYRYQVKGRDFSSEQITLADYSSTTGRAQAIVNRYPHGAAVTVYYNPANPAEAVLERGASGGLNLLYLIGGLFALGGMFFLIMSLTGQIHVRH